MRAAREMFLGTDSTKTTVPGKEIIVNFEIGTCTYPVKITRKDTVDEVKEKIRQEHGIDPKFLKFPKDNFYNAKRGDIFSALDEGASVAVTADLDGGCMVSSKEGQYIEGQKASPGCCCGIPCSFM